MLGGLSERRFGCCSLFGAPVVATWATVSTLCEDLLSLAQRKALHCRDRSGAGYAIPLQSCLPARALEDGVETRVGEGGARLSGGEPEARDSPRHPAYAPITLLDESTASVDQTTNMPSTKPCLSLA